MKNISIDVTLTPDTAILPRIINRLSGRTRPHPQIGALVKEISASRDTEYTVHIDARLIPGAINTIPPDLPIVRMSVYGSRPWICPTYKFPIQLTRLILSPELVTGSGVIKAMSDMPNLVELRIFNIAEAPYLDLKGDAGGMARVIGRMKRLKSLRLAIAGNTDILPIALALPASIQVAYIIQPDRGNYRDSYYPEFTKRATNLYMDLIFLGLGVDWTNGGMVNRAICDMRDRVLMERAVELVPFIDADIMTMVATRIRSQYITTINA